MDEIVLRPTSAAQFDECPRKYYYQYQERIKTEAVSANLPFGTAVHEAVLGWLKGEMEGQNLDPVKIFQDKWERALEEKAMTFSAQWGPEELTKTGERLTERFPETWANTGLTVLVDSDGPLIERRFRVEMEKGLILSLEPDIIAMTPAGEVAVIDPKTTGATYQEQFLELGDQLTAYQWGVEQASPAGIERVDQLGYMELTKRKVPKTSKGKGPEVNPPALVPRRDEALVSDLLQKYRWIADDIRRGRFPRRPRMAFNSPCNMCEFHGLCSRDDWEGLTQDQPQKAVI